MTSAVPHAALRRTDRLMVAGGVLGTLFWGLVSLTTNQLAPLAVYFPLWLGIVGTLVWRRRAALAARLGAWSGPAWPRFLILGFGAVLAEEVLAALANHLTEPLSPILYLIRIGQFWALNLLAFFGFVTGWCLLVRRLEYSFREVFYLAGCWGLFAEKIIFVLPTQPLFFLFTAPPVILTYGLIISPAMLGFRPGPAPRRRLHPLLRYPLTYLVLFLASVPAIGTLAFLRERFPFLFPPPSMVPL